MTFDKLDFSLKESSTHCRHLVDFAPLRHGDDNLNHQPNAAVPAEFGPAPIFDSSASSPGSEQQMLLRVERDVLQAIKELEQLLQQLLPNQQGESHNGHGGTNTGHGQSDGDGQHSHDGHSVSQPPHVPKHPDAHSGPEHSDAHRGPEHSDAHSVPKHPDAHSGPKQPDAHSVPEHSYSHSGPKQPDAHVPQQPDYKPTSGRDLYHLDFSNGLGGDKNISYSMDDNKHNRGGSHIRFERTSDGRSVANFSVDRWPDLPAGWEKNAPANVSDAELEQLKSKRSYRAELTSYKPEDTLQPGHTYEVNFSNQLVKWDHDTSESGDIFFQLHQAQPYGVPEIALGTHKGKFGVLLNGSWHDMQLPPVDQTLGQWQDWTMKIKMPPNSDGSGGSVDFYHNGQNFYSIPDWQLKNGYKAGDPYLKFGIYKAVFNGDDSGKYTNTGGARYRELNFDQFAVTDVSP